MPALRTTYRPSLAGLLLLSMTGVLSGCDGDREEAVQAVPCTPPSEAPAGPLLVRTNCAAYAPADSLVVSFRNTSSQPYLYGPCGVSLEQREGEVWAAVEGCSFGGGVIPQTGEEFCDLCEAYAIVLQPNGESTLDFLLYENLRSGVYRVRAEVNVEENPEPPRDRSETRFSNEFEVRR